MVAFENSRELINFVLPYLDLVELQLGISLVPFNRSRLTSVASASIANKSAFFIFGWNIVSDRILAVLLMNWAELAEYLHCLVLQVVFRGNPAEVRNDKGVSDLVEADHLCSSELTGGLAD